MKFNVIVPIRNFALAATAVFGLGACTLTQKPADLCATPAAAKRLLNDPQSALSISLQQAPVGVDNFTKKIYDEKNLANNAVKAYFQTAVNTNPSKEGCTLVTGESADKFIGFAKKLAVLNTGNSKLSDAQTHVEITKAANRFGIWQNLVDATAKNFVVVN
jgi:hypothetical protein